MTVTVARKTVTLSVREEAPSLGFQNPMYVISTSSAHPLSVAMSASRRAKTCAVTPNNPPTSQEAPPVIS